MSATDDRIKQILKAKAQETNAAERCKDQLTKHIEIMQQLRKKWAKDTHIIADILRDFEQKMVDIKVQLQFQDVGQQGTTIAVGRIFGHVSGRELQLTLNVHPNGEIHVFRAGAGTHHVQFTSVLTADRAQYESLILDEIEVT
jgi:hypothetical protein